MFSGCYWAIQNWQGTFAPGGPRPSGVHWVKQAKTPIRHVFTSLKSSTSSSASGTKSLHFFLHVSHVSIAHKVFLQHCLGFLMQRHIWVTVHTCLVQGTMTSMWIQLHRCIPVLPAWGCCYCHVGMLLMVANVGLWQRVDSLSNNNFQHS